MANIKYGYIQKIYKNTMTEEINAMLEHGVEKENIMIDKPWEEKKFIQLFKKLEAGDILYIDSLRSLGESYFGMSRKWRSLANKDITINTLDFTEMSNDQDIKGVDANIMIDTAFYYFEYIRWAERQNARIKQAQGIEEARKKGIKMGRRSLAIPEEFDEIYEKWISKEISGREASSMLKVDQKTFKKWVATKKNKK